MEQISVRAMECRKAEEGASGPVVVGDRVRYADRLWRVVGMYLVYDPATGQSEEYCVLSDLNNSTQRLRKEGLG